MVLRYSSMRIVKEKFSDNTASFATISVFKKWTSNQKSLEMTIGRYEVAGIALLKCIVKFIMTV